VGKENLSRRFSLSPEGVVLYHEKLRQSIDGAGVVLVNSEARKE
jgi:hypothetical protein